MKQCCRKVVSGRSVPGATWFLVNAWGMQLECAVVLHETLFMPAAMYGSETRYKRRNRGLGLGLYRWTTSEVCLVLGRWIKS